MKTCLAAIMAVAILPTFTTAQNTPGQHLTVTYGVGVVGLSGVYVGQDDELLPFALADNPASDTPNTPFLLG